MSFITGTLVKARNREWVVLSDSTEDFLLLRPLGGTDLEKAGIDTALEKVEPAQFSLPQVELRGDFQSARMLRDAVRLRLESGAGPFRCFGKIAVEPRTYQLVPLLLALRQETVRLLIADDVGIGKTVEALLIARELLERGEIKRFCVLCPPHLAEQWQKEIKSKFHLDAKLVLSSTARALDKECGNRSVFDVFPFTIVSLDYIKSENRRDDFIRSCPEFIIVDEAHTCTINSTIGNRGKGRQQRHDVVSRLSKDLKRHMILVTATPHSGNEGGFLSLLQLLKEEFVNLPSELRGEENRKHRENLARHFVQRRRGDIKSYIDEETVFPVREDQEATYDLSPEYRKLFNRVLEYARERIDDAKKLSKVRQRVCWWAALAMLRTLASSPAAAIASFRSKGSLVNAETPEQVDALNIGLVLDDEPEDCSASEDTNPSSDSFEEDADPGRKKLLELARLAESLLGKNDPKLKKVIPIVRNLLKDEFNPILFCRYLATASYLSDELKKEFGKDVEVLCVTGELSPAEREERIFAITPGKKTILVCTDCLSEGINLQTHFNAVIHYDLAWTPTRHEQREGRVDRYGQPSAKVRCVLFYGINPIDGVVWEVLIRRHKEISRALGITISAPPANKSLMEALYESLIVRGQDVQGSKQTLLPFMTEEENKKTKEFLDAWETNAEQEKKRRTLFAHHALDPAEVASELQAARKALGLGADLKNFVRRALRAFSGSIIEKSEVWQLDFSGCPAGLRDLCCPTKLRDSTKLQEEFNVRFEANIKEGEAYLCRTSPIVQGLAGFVFQLALDPKADANEQSPAARSGVIHTKAVSKRTTLALCRFRFQIQVTQDESPKQLLAEEIHPIAWEGSAAKAVWLDTKQAEDLLNVSPDANTASDQSAHFLGLALADIQTLEDHLKQVSESLAKTLKEQHTRVRQVAKITGQKVVILPQGNPDILGLYVILPV